MNQADHVTIEQSIAALAARLDKAYALIEEAHTKRMEAERKYMAQVQILASLTERVKGHCEAALAAVKDFDDEKVGASELRQAALESMSGMLDDVQEAIKRTGT